jgi:hypothetical protein
MLTFPWHYSCYKVLSNNRLRVCRAEYSGLILKTPFFLPDKSAADVALAYEEKQRSEVCTTGEGKALPSPAREKEKRPVSLAAKQKSHRPGRPLALSLRA